MNFSHEHEIELTLAPSHTVPKQDSRFPDQEQEMDGLSQMEEICGSPLGQPKSHRMGRLHCEQEGRMQESKNDDFAPRGRRDNDPALVDDACSDDDAGEAASCISEASSQRKVSRPCVDSLTQELLADLHKLLFASIVVSTLVAGLQLLAIMYDKAAVQENDESALHAFMRTYPHAGISVFLCAPCWLCSISADFALLPVVNALQVGERRLVGKRIGLRIFIYMLVHCACACSLELWVVAYFRMIEFLDFERFEAHHLGTVGIVYFFLSTDNFPVCMARSFRYGSLLCNCAVCVVIAVLVCYVDPLMVAVSSLPTLKQELFDGKYRSQTPEDNAVMPRSPDALFPFLRSDTHFILIRNLAWSGAGTFFWLGAVVPFVFSVAIAVPKIEILSSMCDLANDANDLADLRQHVSDSDSIGSSISSHSNSSSEENDAVDNSDNDVESGDIEALSGSRFSAPHGGAASQAVPAPRNPASTHRQNTQDPRVN